MSSVPGQRLLGRILRHEQWFAVVTSVAESDFWSEGEQRKFELCGVDPHGRPTSVLFTAANLDALEEAMDTGGKARIYNRLWEVVA